MKLIKFFALLALTAAAVSASAQYSWKIASSSSLVGNNSIVREWGASCLIYTEESATQGKFSLMDENYNLSLNISHVNLRSRYKVRDFVIVGDTVFFVGNYNSKGFWGAFNIRAVFGGGDTIRYYLTESEVFLIGDNGTAGWYCNYLDFDKIQVLPGSGHTRLMFVGDRMETFADNISPHTVHTPCLIHVNTRTLTFDYAYNGVSSEHFDDIALVNNNIVVACRETNTSDSADILFRVFGPSPFSLSCSTSYRQPPNPSLSPVHIVSTGGNTFATAHYGRMNTSTTPKGLFVEYYMLTTIPLFPTSITRNSFSHAGFLGGFSGVEDIRGIMYDATTTTLSVLQTTNDLGLTNPESMLYKFDCTSIPAVSCSTAYEAGQGILLHALGQGSGSCFIASGTQQSGLILMRDLLASPASCFTSNTAAVTTQVVNDGLSTSSATLTTGSYTVRRFTSVVTPSTSQYTVSCQ